MIRDLMQRLQDKEKRMIEIRRHLHKYPELSFHKTEAPKYIANFYKDKDCKVETNTGQHGVKATIDSGKPGKMIAIRTDFDALPIQEDTSLSFVSKNEGVMHACGHDVHTTYMLILAETLIEMKSQFSGEVIVVHQPAEEMPPGGAKGMIEDGVLDGVEHVLSTHVMTNMAPGKIYYHKGNVQIGRSYFKSIVKSEGGHGSSPHTANDAIVAAAHFVTTAQAVVSCRLNPFETGVVTVGSFGGKGQFNAIKDKVTVEGDVRALIDAARDRIETALKQMVHGLEETFSVNCEFTFSKDYPALYNDPDFTEYVAETIEQSKLADVKGVEICEPQPPSEDFAFYAKTLPSIFMYSGAKPRKGKVYPHHRPRFTIDESSMLVAAEAVGTAVLNYLTIE